MYKYIYELEIKEVKISSCQECPNIETKERKTICKISGNILPYIYKFPIPKDCPLP